jgi:hypothetical protein
VALAELLLVAYWLWGNWRLQAALRSAAAAVGCQVDDAFAYTVVPGRFELRDVVLRGCSEGRWSARVEQASGEIPLRSLFDAEPLVKRGDARLSDGDLLGVAVEGALEVRVRGLRLGPVPQALEVELWLSDAALRRDGFDLHVPRRSRLLVRQGETDYAVTLEVPEGSGSLAGKAFRRGSRRRSRNERQRQPGARRARRAAWQRDRSLPIRVRLAPEGATLDLSRAFTR